jgi:hypothetical protein
MLTDSLPTQLVNIAPFRSHYPHQIHDQAHRFRRHGDL